MKRLLRERYNSWSSAGEVNPMDSMANLADIMIVLAVGIMLALIMNWNLDIEAISYKEQPIDNGQKNAVSVESDSIEELPDEAERVDSEGMEKLGTVYYDEAAGKYYIIADTSH